ncbi:unnamed protein product [Diamesa serratosioi]
MDFMNEIKILKQSLEQSDHVSKEQEKNYQDELLKYIHSERNKLVKAKSGSVSSRSSESYQSFSNSSDNNSEFKSFQVRYAKIVQENSRLSNDVQKYLKHQKKMEKNLQSYHEMFRNANQKLIESENTHKILEDNLNKFIEIAKQRILGKTSEE